MFSIIIPLFNKEKSIQLTLNSALDQTFNDFEVIVVDDGSTDESVKKAKEIEDPRIKLVQKENEGVCSARNRGIELARHDYIAFLDADDIWEPDYLSEQHRLIHDLPDAVLWGCAYGHLEGEEKTNVDHLLPDDYRDYIKDYFKIKRSTDLFCSSSVVVHKSAFVKAGLFDTRIQFSEDLDMWYRIIIHFPVVFYNKTLAYYRQDAENRAMKKTHPLVDFLPFYVGKYNSDPDIRDVSFLRYINNWSAVKLMHYYFEVKNERKYAKQAVSDLNYKLIKKKYTLMYKPPFFIGYMAFMALIVKKKLW